MLCLWKHCSFELHEDILMIDDIEGKCYYRQERMQQCWMSDTGYFPQKITQK